MHNRGVGLADALRRVGLHRETNCAQDRAPELWSELILHALAARSDLTILDQAYATILDAVDRGSQESHTQLIAPSIFSFSGSPTCAFR